MSFEVEYTVNAQHELYEAHAWIRERAPAAAAKWLDELTARIDALAANPLKHPPAPESKKFLIEIRLMLFRKRRSQFRIYYTIRKNKVFILSVRRSSRKPLEDDDLSL